MKMLRLRATALFLVGGLMLAACAGDEPDPDAAGDGETEGEEEPAEDDEDDGDDADDGDDPAEDDGDAEGEDLAGTSVTVFGPESSENEAGAVQDMLAVFAEESGIDITYTGARDFSEQITAQAEGGNPPDIAVFPQPGRVKDFGAEGFTHPVPQDLVDSISAQWPEGTNTAYEADGETWGLMNKTDLKSVLWYNTALFEEGGYELPETLDELWELTETMIDDGVTPWCVGIESGPATGWPFTDWMEDILLRREEVDVYDGWIEGEIGFSDERIVAVAEEIMDIWSMEGAVYAAGGSIAATPFGDNGGPLAEGTCAMHRQASFYAAFLPEDTEVGPDGAVDVTYFPAADDGRTPVLTAGTAVSAFRDAPEVWAVIEWMASAEGVTERQAAQAERTGGTSGYLASNLDQDLSVYNDLERSFVEILQTAEPARFDASDMMPGAVGAGSFWEEGTAIVNGDKGIEEAFAIIDDSWPE